MCAEALEAFDKWLGAQTIDVRSARADRSRRKRWPALRAAVEEIEERTRPNGDMADLAVNLVARATLGESDEM